MGVPIKATSRLRLVAVKLKSIRRSSTSSLAAPQDSSERNLRMPSDRIEHTSQPTYLALDSMVPKFDRTEA
jgi:hypothetical protein